ncbi:MAG: DUF262 domain-containing HNH endonuclease family protein [Dehalococcoidia bacterium]|nr:DUF262 domain-containing HNH endonuclease family protein [Dehalococcoidia bacterium]
MIEIQPQLLPLSGLLSKRLFRIPQYQRAYSWHSKHREDLFGDILNTWRAGGDRQHFMATVVGLRREKRMIGTDEHQVVEIVDGQQRVTTLILLLKAIAKTVDRTDLEGSRVGRELDETLVKPDKASLLLLQTNHDLSNHFASYLRTGSHPPSESANTQADRELLLAMEECEQFLLRCKGNGLPVVDLLSLLKNRLTFVFHEIGDEALVYTVFEVLNSRGLEVSWFDRLKSMLMAIVFEAEENSPEIINEVHTLWSDIYRCVGLRIGMSTESLRFAACLRQESAPSRLPSEEDAADILREQAKISTANVIEVTNWLKAVTEAMDKVLGDRRTRGVTRIVQARLVAAAIHLRSDLTDGDKTKVLRLWENIAFRMYGISGLDARYAVGEYLRLAWSIVNENLDRDAILAELSRIGAQYPITKAVDHLRNTDCYNGWQEELRYFLFRYEEHLAKKAGQNFNNEQWNRIWMANASDSIEHILPQSSESDKVDRLGNLILLPPKLNSKLRALAPLKKAEEYRKTGLLIARKAADQIEGSRWGPGQIKIREEALLDWAKSEWAD